ncbi:MAG TPA: membrane protein insertase YidC [Acidisarcina sp.]
MPEIRNPNQQGPGAGGDSRSLLIMAVVFVLFFLGLQYFKRKAPEPQPQSQNTAAQNMPVQNMPVQSSSTAEGGSAGGGPAAHPAAAANAVQASSESTTIVENELYRITFSNRGAQVTSWILKKHKDEEGHPLDLVNVEAARRFGYPLSLYSYDAALRTHLAQALFVPSATGTLSAPATLSYDYSDGNVVVRKSFRFDSSYVIHADVTATSNGAPLTTLLAWPAGFGDQQTAPQYAGSHFDTMQGGKSEQVAPKKVSGGGTLNGPFDYAGVSDLYFASIFLPDAPQQATLVSLHNQIAIPKDRKKPDPNSTYPADVLGAAVGDTTGHLSTRLFVGPKSIDLLNSLHTTAANGAATGANLQPVISFGFMTIIAKPLFLALRWFHEHLVANWGWDILILTVLINICMLPTRVQMMRSALKMQRIQPQMEAIKEKYKKYKATDPRKQDMNKELFDLQKREGANMFGGCLPMLIQWPLLYGFYRMLTNVIELRQAHWLWLPDLSSPDPYHILPVFFIISMFLTQYLTPSPGVDPAQQRMMAFTMPAVFGFMTWNIGSGLALYWACGNIISVIQQLVMNRTGIGKEMRAIAAKRAAKRLGRPAPGRR